MFFFALCNVACVEQLFFTPHVYTLVNLMDDYITAATYKRMERHRNLTITVYSSLILFYGIGMRNSENLEFLIE